MAQTFQLKRGDVKRFRELLNKDDKINHRNGQYHQKSRPYGDYIYAQDRDKFMVDLREWLMEQGGEKA